MIDIEQKMMNLDKWFHKKNERPLLGFFHDSQYPLHRYPGSRRSIPRGEVDPGDVIVGDFIDDYERLYEIYERCGGDLIWSGAPFFGLPWLEASLGCRVVADHAAGSTRAEAPPGFDMHHDIPGFDPESGWIRKLDEFYDMLYMHSRGRYPVGVTLMRGISDILSALYGGSDFIYGMMDRPEEIDTVIGKVTRHWIDFGKHMMAKAELFHGGTGAFFYGVWCPGRTIWLQEDAAALLSPVMYDRFIHGPDMEIIGNFENSVMHLHPSGFIPADRLVKSGIGVIELHRDKGGPSVEELYPYYLKILREKPLIIWGDMTEEELGYIFEKIPHQGLLVNMVVSTEEEAVRLWDRHIGTRKP